MITLQQEYEIKTGNKAVDKYFSAEPANSLPPTPSSEYVEWLEQEVLNLRTREYVRTTGDKSIDFEKEVLGEFVQPPLKERTQQNKG